MKTRAVLFDLDNTLFDHEASARDGVIAFLRHLGTRATAGLLRSWFEIEQSNYDRYLAGGISFEAQRRERLRQFLPLTGFAVPYTETGLDELFGSYLKEYEQHWASFRDAAPVLRRLRESGIPVGIITNGNHDQQCRKIQRIGIAPYVDGIFSSELIGYAKPTAEAFLLPCKEMQLDPSRTVYVGDNYRVDVEGARNAGLQAVHLDRSGSLVAGSVRSLTELIPLLTGVAAAGWPSSAGTEGQPASGRPW